MDIDANRYQFNARYFSNSTKEAMMPVIELSQAMIQNLHVVGTASRTEWCDTVVKGLYLLVSQTGARSYFWRTKIEGKTTHFPVGHASEVTLAAARDQVLRWKSEAEAPGTVKADAAAPKLKREMTLSDFWKDYYLPLAKQRKRSWQRDDQLWRIRIEPKFGAQRLCDINRQEIQLFHGNLVHEAKLAPATADLHAALLKRMLSLCVEWDILEKNPAAKMQLFHADNRVENYLDEAQLTRLLEVLRTSTCREVCQIALFALATGCRQGEALQAQWSQIDKDHRVWRIPAGSTKSGKGRSVPLNEIAMEVLSELTTEGKYKHLFINPSTKEPFVHIRHTWIRLRKKAGLPHLRFHDLRHSTASLLIQSGASLYLVQQILGHASPVMTQRYSHVAMHTLHDASGNMANIIHRAKQSGTQQTSEVK
jgi:integrase